MKNIFSRVRAAVHGFFGEHPDFLPSAASAVRCCAMLTTGTAGSGRPWVVAVCASVVFVVDCLVLRLSR